MNFFGCIFRMYVLDACSVRVDIPLLLVITMSRLPLQRLAYTDEAHRDRYVTAALRMASAEPASEKELSIMISTHTRGASA